jgi:hypothetical protein
LVTSPAVSRIALFVSSLSLMAVLAGCHDPLTQVVVVLQSDLDVPAETDGIVIIGSEGRFAPDNNAASVHSEGQLFVGFPLSVGVNSAGGTSTFSMTVQLLQGLSNVLQTAPLIVVNRTVTDIRFVDQQTMMLVLPLLRVCACQGTSCPNPGNPACDNIERPALQPFDPTVAPPSTMMSVNGITAFPIAPPGRGGLMAPETGVLP